MKKNKKKKKKKSRVDWFRGIYKDLFTTTPNPRRSRFTFLKRNDIA
jgi:hypothetical protein